MITSQTYGFFGVKQKDPLSPSLFILVAKILSMVLKNLFKCAGFQGYGLPPRSEKINHLSYADNTIIFVKVDSTTLELLMKSLNDYEAQSS